MPRFRVAIIGHVVLEEQEIRLPAGSAARDNLLKINNYLRVATDADTMVDDLSYFARRPEGERAGRLSIWDIYLTAGLLLSSHLRRNDFDVKLINAIEPDTAAGHFADLRAFAPDVVVLCTTFVLAKPQFMQISHLIRRSLPEAFIVAGGQHIYTSLLHMKQDQRESYLKTSQLDAFVNDSQGEAALLRLCRARASGAALDDIANLMWVRADGSIVQNAAKPEENDINETLIDFSDVPAGSVVHMRTARSCAFKCAFCSYPSIAGDLALMGLDNIVSSLRRAKERGVQALVFSDDTFNVPAERFETILDAMIEAKIDLPWYSFLRCQYLNERMVDKMRAARCSGVFLGIESGSDRILKNMKKGSIARFYRNGIGWLKEREITTVGAFVVGFPGETDDTVATTQAFIEDTGIDYYFVQPFFYLHHAPIHLRAKEFDLTGNGLFWSHRTMNWKTAVEHINRLFLEIKNSTFINPDNNLWEYVYLRSKGFSRDEFRNYRHLINGQIAQQMTRFGMAPAQTGVMGITSRHEDIAVA